jgi:RNA polymerase sigma factor (sigma-70 family)
MAGADSFDEFHVVLDAAIRAVAARWRLRGADAEDFAQHVRVAVLRREQAALRQFRGQGAFTYFYRIATRIEIDRLRSELGRTGTPRHRVREPQPDRRAIDSPPAAVPLIGPDVEVHALHEHVVSGLTRVLAVLTAEEREVLARRFGRDESANTIARATGGSRRSAARRLHALLSEIRDLLLQVQVSDADVKQVLELCRIDAALLDDCAAADPIRSDPIPDRPSGGIVGAVRADRS